MAVPNPKPSPLVLPPSFMDACTSQSALVEERQLIVSKPPLPRELASEFYSTIQCQFRTWLETEGTPLAEVRQLLLAAKEEKALRISDPSIVSQSLPDTDRTERTDVTLHSDR